MTVSVTVLVDVLTVVLGVVVLVDVLVVGGSVVVVVVVDGAASDVVVGAVVVGVAEVPVGETVTVSVAPPVVDGAGVVSLTDADGVVVVDAGECESPLVNFTMAKISRPRTSTVAMPRPTSTAGLRCQGVGSVNCAPEGYVGWSYSL